MSDEEAKLGGYDIWVHIEKGTRYRHISECSFKTVEGWVDGVIYTDEQSTYARPLGDMVSKFERKEAR